MGNFNHRVVRGLAAAFLLLMSACASAHSATATPPLPLPETATASPTEVDPLPEASQEASSPTLEATPPAPPEMPELNDASIKKQVDQLATWFLGQGRNPGLGISVVVRDPQTGQLRAMLLNYGSSGKGQAQLASSNTIYEIGSITKVFTGTLLAEDVMAGKAQLQDPIQAYLPAQIQAPAYDGTAITLADLATHRSGLPRDINTDTISEMYGWLNGFQLSRKPGAEYAYSNVGFSLLGDLLAKQADTDFDTLEYQSVSKPLGMFDTRESLDAEQDERLAQGSTYDGSPAQPFPDAGAMSGAGYLRSTLADMTRFLAANMQPDSSRLGGALELAQTVQAAGRNPGTGVGLGWEIDGLGTTRERLYKGGGTIGFTSYITFMRDRSAGFVILTNGMYGETLAPHLVNLLGMNH